MTDPVITERLQDRPELPAFSDNDFMPITRGGSPLYRVSVATLVGRLRGLIGELTSAVTSINGQAGDVELTAISLDAIPLSVLDQAEGVAALGSDRKIAEARLPESAFTPLQNSGAPLASGNATRGSSGFAARSDHVHPSPTAAEIGAAEVVVTGGEATPVDLAASAARGNSAKAARADHVHKRPTPAEIGAPTTSELTTALAGKSDTSHGHSAATSSVAGFMTGADRLKIDAIAAQATRVLMSSASPAALGVATVGTSIDAARADHAHAMPTYSQVGAAKDDLSSLSVTNTAVDYIGYKARSAAARNVLSNKVRELGLTVSDGGAVPSQGADITAALQAAIDLAAAEIVLTGGSAKVSTPPSHFGYCYVLSGTIFLPDGVHLDLTGTSLKRSGDYGPSFLAAGSARKASTRAALNANLNFAAGTLAVVYADTTLANNVAYVKLGASGAGSWATIKSQSVGGPACDNVVIEGGQVWHDHGGFLYAPEAEGAWTNPVVRDSAHVVLYHPRRTRLDRMDLYSLRGIDIWGGVDTDVISCYHWGVFDDQSTIKNASKSSLRINGDYDHTRGYPTNIRVIGGMYAGPFAAAASVAYPGASGAITNTRNIGPKDVCEITAAEGVYFFGTYFGAGNNSNVAFRPFAGSPCSDIVMTSCFVDSAGYTENSGGIICDPQDDGGYVGRLQIIGVNANGQGNGLRFINDTACTGPRSFVNLTVIGQANTYVANPVELTKAQGTRLDLNCVAYNFHGLMTGNKACAVHIGAGSRLVDVGGILGGDNIFSPTSHNCVDGIRADAGPASLVTVRAINGGLLGRLYVGGPSIFMPDANYTLTPGQSAPTSVHLSALTADRTVTLANSGGVATGDYGRRQLISRVTTTDKFVLTVVMGAAGSIKILSGEAAEFEIATDGNWRLIRFSESPNVGTTVANLPPATLGFKRRFVSDANAATFGTAVVGGGSNKVPVYSDGVTWLIG